MKINTRLGIVASFAFILTGLVILGATFITGEKSKEGWLILGVGIFLGAALIIKVILPMAIKKKKKSLLSGKRHQTGPYSRVITTLELCSQGKMLKIAAHAEKGVGPYTPAWDIHRQSCPVCHQAEEGN